MIYLTDITDPYNQCFIRKPCKMIRGAQTFSHHCMKKVNHISIMTSTGHNLEKTLANNESYINYRVVMVKYVATVAPGADWQNCDFTHSMWLAWH